MAVAAPKRPEATGGTVSSPTPKDPPAPVSKESPADPHPDVKLGDTVYFINGSGSHFAGVINPRTQVARVIGMEPNGKVWLAIDCWPKPQYRGGCERDDSATKMNTWHLPPK